MLDIQIGIGCCSSVLMPQMPSGLRKIDHTFSQPDLIIAATAQHYDLTIVSRDTSDFEKARVMAFNPWIEAAPHETEWPDVAMSLGKQQGELGSVRSWSWALLLD
jgi:hypothetical protein